MDKYQLGDNRLKKLFSSGYMDRLQSEALSRDQQASHYRDLSNAAKKSLALQACILSRPTRQNVVWSRRIAGKVPKQSARSKADWLLLAHQVGVLGLLHLANRPQKCIPLR